LPWWLPSWVPWLPSCRVWQERLGVPCTNSLDAKCWGSSGPIHKTILHREFDHGEKTQKAQAHRDVNPWVGGGSPDGVGFLGSGWSMFGQVAGSSLSAPLKLLRNAKPPESFPSLICFEMGWGGPSVPISALLPPSNHAPANPPKIGQCARGLSTQPKPGARADCPATPETRIPRVSSFPVWDWALDQLRCYNIHVGC
jgi:hypothetical protein